MGYPDLRIGGLSTFFDHDMTIFCLLQDVFFLVSFFFLTRNLHSKTTLKKQGAYGLSSKTLLLYALTFTCRLAEYSPFDHLSYDLVCCILFAILSWTSLITTKFIGSSNDLSIGTRSKPSDSFWLHLTVGATAILAYRFNYSHLKLTRKVFLWAWSHYLEGVAPLPQMWLLLQANRKRLQIPHTIWLALGFLNLYRIFQLLKWAYLLVEAEMLDRLAVASACYHLVSYLLFYAMLFVQNEMIKRGFLPSHINLDRL